MDEFKESRQISIQEMNELTTKLREAKAAHAVKAREEKEAKLIVTELEEQILACLNEADIPTFVGAGGRVTCVKKLAVRIPDSPENKQKFFKWLEKHQGREVAEHYMTVNSQALNTLYNSLVEEYGNRGEILEIDGLELPTYRESLSFTKV